MIRALHRSPLVVVQALGPSIWRISVPGVYLTVAEGEIERDAAITVASRMARRRYADAYPSDSREWQ